MGIRVSFELGAPDGLEGMFWGSDPSLFRDWLRAEDREDPGFYAPELLSRLDQVVTEGPSSLAPRDRQDAQILDAIFDAFVGDYCILEAQSLLENATGGFTNVYYFERAQELVESRCSPQVAQCWRDLLQGRAVGRPSSPYPYTPSDVVFRLGYWTAAEVQIVHDSLQTLSPAELRRNIPWWARGARARTRDNEVVISTVLTATARALERETGLITTVA